MVSFFEKKLSRSFISFNCSEIGSFKAVLFRLVGESAGARFVNGGSEENLRLFIVSISLLRVFYIGIF